MTRGHVALALSLASCAAEPVQPPVSRRPAVPRVLPGEPGFGARDCEERFRSPVERRAEELVAARVCDVDGLPVPLRFCDGIAAP